MGLGLSHRRRRNRETIHRMANPDPNAVRLWGLCIWCIRGSSYVFVLGLLIMVIAGVLHSSLTHEVLHGHPFNSAFVNALLVFPALIIFIPYLRFKDTHLDHHRDERLTDPYDDPETNFMDPQVWDQLPKWRQSLHLFNNTLLGRMFLGPVLSQIAFMRADLRLILAGDRRVALGWLLHVPSLIVAYVMVVMIADVPIWLWFGRLSVDGDFENPYLFGTPCP